MEGFKHITEWIYKDKKGNYWKKLGDDHYYQMAAQEELLCMLIEKTISRR